MLKRGEMEDAIQARSIRAEVSALRAECGAWKEVKKRPHDRIDILTKQMESLMVPATESTSRTKNNVSFENPKEEDGGVQMPLPAFAKATWVNETKQESESGLEQAEEGFKKEPYLFGGFTLSINLKPNAMATNPSRVENAKIFPACEEPAPKFSTMPQSEDVHIKELGGGKEAAWTFDSAPSTFKILPAVRKEATPQTLPIFRDITSIVKAAESHPQPATIRVLENKQTSQYFGELAATYESSRRSRCLR